MDIAKRIRELRESVGENRTEFIYAYDRSKR